MKRMGSQAPFSGKKVGHLRAAGLVLIFLFNIPTSLTAEKYALLIGIGAYPDIRNLDGPRFDVEILQEDLVRDWGFDDSNVVILIDEAATQLRILAEIDDLIARTKAGDHVFLYYSGHGTSVYDPDFPDRYSLESSTSALIPFDFNLTLGEEGRQGKLIERLVVGQRDLGFRFSRLDRDRDVFVVFDSCFSGQAVRWTLHPGSMLPSPPPSDPGVQSISSQGTHYDPLDDNRTFGTAPRIDTPHPYRQLIFLSAARRFEHSMELPGSLSIDGRPHGALTDALIRGLRGSADSNHDGRISYRELYNYVQMRVRERHSQNPLLRYPENRPALLERSVFDEQ